MQCNITRKNVYYFPVEINYQMTKRRQYAIGAANKLSMQLNVNRYQQEM